jgi:hypothetical protein
MVSTCKGMCDRFKKVDHTKTSYITGKIAYCRNCMHMFHIDDIVNYRCQCCKGKVRTHVRSSRRREMLKLRVKRY